MLENPSGFKSETINLNYELDILNTCVLPEQLYSIKFPVPAMKFSAYTHTPHPTLLYESSIIYSIKCLQSRQKRGRLQKLVPAGISVLHHIITMASCQVSYIFFLLNSFQQNSTKTPLK